MFYSIVTMPTAQNTLDQVSNSASPFFTEFLPVVYVFIGLLIGGLLVSRVISFFLGVFRTNSDDLIEPSDFQYSEKDNEHDEYRY